MVCCKPGLNARHLDRVPLPGRKSARVTCRVTVIRPNRRMRTRMSGGVGGGANHSPRPDWAFSLTSVSPLSHQVTRAAARQVLGVSQYLG